MKLWTIIHQLVIQGMMIFPALWKLENIERIMNQGYVFHYRLLNFNLLKDAPTNLSFAPIVRLRSVDPFLGSGLLVLR